MLRESKGIVILRPDKVCGTVILDREEYVKKIYEKRRFLNKQNPNRKFTFETNSSTTIFCKEAAIGLFTNYLSFTPFLYKIGLVKTLIHCDFKICSNWCLFHAEANNIKKYLEKIWCPKNFINREIKTYLEPPKVSYTVKLSYYKLPYIGHFSKTTKQKLKKNCDQYCKDSSVKIVFTPFKVGDLFSVKDAIPKLLKSFVVYKFVCPGCIACYIGETTRHLSTRIEKHLEKDTKSYISKHLNENHNCKSLSTPDCFQIIDSASSRFRLKLKEAMHMTRTKPSLNRQLKHVSISINV